jgi:hypothetical protein
MIQARLIPTMATLLATMSYLAAPILAEAGEPQQATITGTIDGEEMSWQLQTDQRAPSAVFTSLATGTHRFHINAYSNERHVRKDSIELELLITDGEVRSAELLYFPFPRSHPRFSFGSNHGTGTINIDSLMIESGQALLSARFEGELYYHQSVNTSPIPHRTRAASLQFDVTAVRE